MYNSPYSGAAYSSTIGDLSVGFATYPGLDTYNTWPDQFIKGNDYIVDIYW